MEKFFVVGTNKMSIEDEKVFKVKLEKRGLIWWHWIDNIWLIKDKRGSISCSDIRNLLEARNLVLEVEPITWSGRGPASDDKNMFKWIKNFWSS